jgi:hypothetical protein
MSFAALATVPNLFPREPTTGGVIAHIPVVTIQIVNTKVFDFSLPMMPSAASFFKDFSGLCRGRWSAVSLGINVARIYKPTLEACRRATYRFERRILVILDRDARESD